MAYDRFIGFFRKNKRDPVERLEGELRDRRAARDKLTDRLSAAEAALVEKRGAAQRLAMAGAADQALDQAEAMTRAADGRATTLRAALTQLDVQIAETERALADAETQHSRDTVVDELETMASAIADAVPAYDTAALRLITAVTQSSASMVESSQFAASLDAMHRDVAAASKLLCAELRAAAVRTRSGQASIGFRQPPKPEPTPPVEIARATVFTLSRVRWQESGVTRTAPAFAQVHLPSALLSVAVQNNHVDRLSSPRSQNLMQLYGSGHAFQPPYEDDPSLIDLDSLAALEDVESTEAMG